MIGGDTRSDRDALWREALLDAEAQALEDLAGTLGAEVVLLQYPSATVGGAHLDAAARRSAAAGFVTARVRWWSRGRLMRSTSSCAPSRRR